MVNYFKEKFNGKVTRVCLKIYIQRESGAILGKLFIQVDMKINQTGENKGFAFLTFDSTEGWGYDFLLFRKNFL